MSPQIGVTSERPQRALQLTPYDPNSDRRYVTTQCNGRAWRYTLSPLGECNDACNGRGDSTSGKSLALSTPDRATKPAHATACYE